MGTAVNTLLAALVSSSNLNSVPGTISASGTQSGIYQPASYTAQ